MVSWSGMYGRLIVVGTDSLLLSSPVADGFLVRFVGSFDGDKDS